MSNNSSNTNIENEANNRLKRQIFYELMDPFQLLEVQNLMIKNVYDIGGAPTQKLLGTLPLNLFNDASLMGGLIHSIIQNSYQAIEQMLCLLYVGCINKDPTEVYEKELRNSKTINDFADKIILKEIPKCAEPFILEYKDINFNDFILLSIFGNGFDKVARHEQISKFPIKVKEDLIRDISEIAKRYREFNYYSAINAFKHGARTKLATSSLIEFEYDKNDLFVCRLIKQNSPNERNVSGVLGEHFDIEFEKQICEFCCSVSEIIVKIRKQNTPNVNFKSISLSHNSRFNKSDKRIFITLPNLKRKT